MLPISATAMRALFDPLDEGDLLERVWAHDYTKDVLDSTFVLASLLLLQTAPSSRIAFPNVHGTPYERFLDETLRCRKYLGQILTTWATVNRSDFGLYPIYLFNTGWGDTRSVLRLLLKYEPAPPPYLYLFLLNALRQALGIPHDRIASLLDGPFENAAREVRSLFSTGAFASWLTRKSQPMRFYAGATNTVVGLYDGLVLDSATGLADFNRNAAGRYDLGGGFNTSELERLLGCSFVSADILGPRYEDYDPELVLHVASSQGTPRVATESEREAHRARQRSVVHLPMDVLREGFPQDAASYAIVSTGFLTSTVRPNEHPPSWQGRRNTGMGQVGLSLHAIARVMELVQTRKPVDLFTIQRASGRLYKYKTVFAQWRGGRMTGLVTTDDRQGMDRWSPDALAQIRARVDPLGEHFAKLS